MSVELWKFAHILIRFISNFWNENINQKYLFSYIFSCIKVRPLAIFFIFKLFCIPLCSWGQMNNIQLFFIPEISINYWYIWIFVLPHGTWHGDSTYLPTSLLHSKTNSLWTVNMMISTLLIEISVSKVF